MDYERGSSDDMRKRVEDAIGCAAEWQNSVGTANTDNMDQVVAAIYELTAALYEVAHQIALGREGHRLP